MPPRARRTATQVQTAQRPMTMAEFASSITTLGDMMPSFNGLIYGEPGCGKTGLVGGLPDALLLACDPGYVTAHRMGYKPAFQVVNGYERLMAALNFLENGGAENYRWVILDGLTVLQSRLLFEFCGDAWTENNAKRVSAYQPDKPDYFKAQNVLKSSVARLCDLPTNVMFTAHASSGYDTDGDRWVRPHIDGRQYHVGNAVCALPNAIGYMYPSVVDAARGTRKQVRRIRWQQYYHEETDTRYLAKDQTMTLGETTDDITASQFDGLVIDGEVVNEKAEKPRERAGARSR